MQGSDGWLYGTTSDGGSMGSIGTAFRLDLEGAAYTVIHDFLMTGGDGCNPQAALVAATNGCLYGTTQNGGTYDQGGIFKIMLGCPPPNQRPARRRGRCPGGFHHPGPQSRRLASDHGSLRHR